MAKSPFSNRIRLTLLKGMEAVGTTASNMASNAKIRANEINLENRRREILTSFSLRAFELWQKGETLPQPLSEMLVELSDIDDRLSLLRAQKYAKVAGPVCGTDGEAKTQPAEDDAAAQTEENAVQTEENAAGEPAETDTTADAASTAADADPTAPECSVADGDTSQSVPCEFEKDSHSAPPAGDE